jgi:hypothetical protein
LPDTVERQVIEDIEESGGLTSGFKLLNLCKAREDLYGEAGSERRKRIQKRVVYWKKFPERYYYRLRELGVRLGCAKKKQSPSPAKPPRVSSHRKQQTPPVTKPSHKRSEDQGDRDDCTGLDVFISDFSRLNMSGRFEFESDLSIDAETKERIRSNTFDEQVSLDAALLQQPAFTRLGVLFQALRNKQNHVQSFTADGFVLSVPAQEQDFLRGRVTAHLLSRHELPIKVPLMNANAVLGLYSGKYEQSYHATISYMMEKGQEVRQLHYVLFKFPTSCSLENVFSRTPTACKIDPEFAWYPSNDRNIGPVSQAQWAIAVEKTKQRVRLNDHTGETAEERAAREAYERTRDRRGSRGVDDDFDID